MPPEGATIKASAPATVEPRAWAMLFVLMLVYVLNFVDRQLLTILAPDLKRDLGIGDSEFGFLYGTVFGVFYAVFGIPLGKLADRWSRVRLLALGLSLWSVMTALSGLARNFPQIAAARMGVGIGEASASPCAYSLVSDCFPPHRRGLALGFYSAGLYIGGGVSLFLGSAIAGSWNDAYATGIAPFGLAGWQAAFLAVGLPGVLLAAVVVALPEPPRGRFDAARPAPASPVTAIGSPWREFLRDVGDILPPFTLVTAALRGGKALAVNLAGAALIGLVMTALVAAMGDPVQWIAFGLGAYAVWSWTAALRQREPAAFAALLGSRAFVCVTLAYSLVSLVGYASTAFTPLYAIEVLGADPREAGWMLGGMGALGGCIGVIGGGMLADRLARNGDQSGRIRMAGACALGMMLCHALAFTASSLPVLYAIVPLSWIFASATLGGSSSLIVNIVPAQWRGAGTAAFLLGTNLIGLALGPYAGGKMSEALSGLGHGMLSLLVVVPVVGMLLWRAHADIRAAR